ncbi:hypothetical protein EHS25_007106 [Saitozyma podzolica]|uniref:Uncharacterized protein n=1 Tax=Saitozyma podzolica TaxID=1890683 RepID=A0A427XPL8_9TREE|nr:hypothetical protein EHS25_007106 [Saitozyma podzolica]
MAGTSPAPAPAPAAPGIQGEDGAGTGCDVVVDPAIPPCPGGLFNFPPGSVLVEDADEEIMELYMDLASVSSSSADDAPDSGGLGFLDSTKSAIEIDWELSPGVHEVDSGIVETRGEDAASTSGIASRAGGAGSGSRRRTTGARAVKRTRPNPAPVRSVQVRATIQQDLGALKGRKGDTGSVLWRSSLHLAHHLLTQHHFPPSTHPPLLDPAVLGRTAILELGAGTGVLAVLLSGMCGGYTASDRIENLRLVKRNLELNGVGVGGGGGGGGGTGSRIGNGIGNGIGNRIGNGSGRGTGSRQGGGGGGEKGMMAGGSASGGSGGGTESSSGGRNAGNGKSRGTKESHKDKDKVKAKDREHDGETDDMHPGRHGRHDRLGRPGEAQRNPRARSEVNVEEVDWVAVSEGVARRRRTEQRLKGVSPVSSPTSPTGPTSSMSMSPTSPTSPIYPAGRPVDMAGTEGASYFQSIATQSPLSASASASAGATRISGGTPPPLDPLLILAVDCIYNEHLIRPLVDTLEHYCRPGSGAVVWVVVELRSADVLTLFLDTWLNGGDAGTGTGMGTTTGAGTGTRTTGWTVVRLGPGGMGSWEGRKGRWVGWVGWR